MSMDTVSLGIDIGDCDISSKYFAILDKIPTKCFRL